jgi:phasin
MLQFASTTEMNQLSVEIRPALRAAEPETRNRASKGIRIMAESVSAASKAKTAKQNASPFGMPHFEIPTFDMPKIELPEAFRQMTEKGVAQAKDTYEKAKVTADEATDLLKGTYATATKGAADYNLKVIEIARANTNTAFENAHEMLGVKSPLDFFVLSTEHARKQFEAMTAQTKELTELAQKVTTNIAEPLKAGASRAFNNKLA